MPRVKKPAAIVPANMRQPIPSPIDLDDDDSQVPRQRVGSTYAGEVWAQKLLNQLYEASLEHQAKTKDARKKRNIETRGPRNKRDKLIFECFARGLPISIIVAYSGLSDAYIISLRQRWTEDGTLAARLKMLRDGADALTSTLNEKALLKLSQLMDNGSEEAQVQSAKALIAAESAAQGRRAKTESDDKFISAADEYSQRMVDALTGYKPRVIDPALITRSRGVVPKIQDAQFEVISDGLNFEGAKEIVNSDVKTGD